MNKNKMLKNNEKGLISMSHLRAALQNGILSRQKYF